MQGHCYLRDGELPLGDFLSELWEQTEPVQLVGSYNLPQPHDNDGISQI